MKKNFWLPVAAMILLASCTQPFKKAKDGSEYKVISNAAGKKAVQGNIMEMNILAKYKDSVLFSSVESGSPRFIPYDTAQMPPFFKVVHEGDSLVLRIKTDTLIKNGQNAPFMKKGEYLYQYFKIAKIYATQAEADVAAEKYAKNAKAISYKKTSEQIEKDLATVNAAQMKKDDAMIQEYLAKNNLQATKTKWGTYVVITTEGSGPVLDQNTIGSLNYTGKTFKDSTFDSNLDPKFKHVEPLYVDLSEFGVIPGWIDGLKLFKKGSKGKLIIPSSLGYGKSGNPPRIGPDENLVFDIEVLDIVTPEFFKQKQQEREMKMMEEQQKAIQQQQQQQQPKVAPKPDVKSPH